MDLPETLDWNNFKGLFQTLSLEPNQWTIKMKPIDLNHENHGNFI